ncbi:hypothetical protein HMPREF9372_2150 [Sporosarcina newyorkensis 2681]|uniref:Uncharacterized protein n=1 Tax=Sporosarcina newyorkensis 2681 TaxID=1027292 RepID=F9DTM0_9BACL|nr:hypothetical protein HMPREF9372_2150 [Sporosarcina newyorkensis 2681]
MFFMGSIQAFIIHLPIPILHTISLEGFSIIDQRKKLPDVLEVLKFNMKTGMV